MILPSMHYSAFSKSKRISSKLLIFAIDHFGWLERVPSLTPGASCNIQFVREGKSLSVYNCSCPGFSVYSDQFQTQCASLVVLRRIQTLCTFPYFSVCRCLLLSRCVCALSVLSRTVCRFCFRRLISGAYHKTGSSGSAVSSASGD